jgi:3-deoxy-manno-octulosonate cytidylyltransferase (CMP-KDO synthetase)
MKAVGVIPARFGSTRFPGKPLALVAGRPLLQWVIEAAQKSERLTDVIVATDNGPIFDFVRGLGVAVVMTSPDLPSGSDRVYAAVLNKDVDIVVNIQGDEPLLEPHLLDALIAPFEADAQTQMSTLGTAMVSADLTNPNVVKVIADQNQNAIYFSRFAIPYSRVDAAQLPGQCLKHVGLYAYRKAFLAKFCDQSPVGLELAESLEQLRALYLGATIRLVCVDCDLQGVDTPEDVQKVEKLMAKRNENGA